MCLDNKSLIIISIVGKNVWEGPNGKVIEVFALDQCYLIRSKFAQEATFGNVWRHFGCEKWWWEKGKKAAGIQWTGVRNAAKYSTMHKTSHHSKEYWV